MNTQELIDGAKAMLDSITPGPWEFDDHEDNDYDSITVGAGTYLSSPGCYTSTDLIHEVDTYSYELEEQGYIQATEDAKFIAAAPELVRKLTDELEKLLGVLIDGTVANYKREHNLT